MRLLICAALAVMVAGCDAPRPAADPERPPITLVASQSAAEPFVVRGRDADDLQGRTEVLANLAYTITLARSCRLRDEPWSFYLTARLFSTVDATVAEMPNAQPSGPDGVRSFVNGAIFASATLGSTHARIWGVVICPIVETDPSLRTIDGLAR